MITSTDVVGELEKRRYFSTLKLPRMITYREAVQGGVDAALSSFGARSLPSRAPTYPEPFYIGDDLFDEIIRRATLVAEEYNGALYTANWPKSALTGPPTGTESWSVRPAPKVPIVSKKAIKVPVVLELRGGVQEKPTPGHIESFEYKDSPEYQAYLKKYRYTGVPFERTEYYEDWIDRLYDLWIAQGMPGDFETWRRYGRYTPSRISGGVPLNEYEALVGATDATLQILHLDIKAPAPVYLERDQYVALVDLIARAANASAGCEKYPGWEYDLYRFKNGKIYLYIRPKVS